MKPSRQFVAETMCIAFEGREIRCRPGLSIAAALTSAGEMKLRDAESGDMRGLFCGMGVCQECRVDVNGRQGVRACMTFAEDSLRIFRHKRSDLQSPGHYPMDGGKSSNPLAPDVLVVGAGPSGLTAAAVAAEAGAEVTLVDERPNPGGQFYKQPASFDLVPASLCRDPQFAAGRALIERVERSGAKRLAGTEIWGAFSSNEFAAMGGHRSWTIQPKRTIVAAGAFERGLPLPGWTLPGVMMTGAAQTLLRCYGVLPGRRVLVAGNGPLNLQVALEMKRAGADIVAVVELAATPGPAVFGSVWQMLLNSPQLTLNGLRCLAELEAIGVPVLHRRVLMAIEKCGAGLRVLTGRIRSEGPVAETTFDADVVCMGYGFQPSNEIQRGLGCRHSYDERRGHLVTERNSDCETSVAGVYAIGDCCGLGGAPAAIQEGVVAAAAAVSSLGLDIPSRIAKERQKALRILRRQRAFQDALWRLFAAPRYQTELAEPDTPVCRCENVRLRDLHDALAGGDSSIGMVKRRTRLGMGPCQGRYCAPVAAAVIARHTGRPIDEFSFFAPRMPLKPIRIGDMAV